MESKPQTIDLGESPIQDIVKKFSYYPNIREFPHNESIPLTPSDKTQFEKYFPKYLSFIKSIETLFIEYWKMHSKKDSKPDLLIRNCVKKEEEKYESELNEFMGKYWIDLKVPTKCHTNLFFHLALMQLNISKFTQYDINILYWTILFHDTGKHQQMNPFIEQDFKDAPVDKTHPFKSTIILIESLIKGKLIYFSNEENEKEFSLLYKEFCTDIYKSFVPEKKNQYGNYMYNLGFEYISTIEKFILFLHQQKENLWIYDIVCLIIFHQSLPNNDEYMNHPLLEEKYIVEFFDLRLIDMMRYIMVYDSCSHSLFKGGKWISEINKHIDQVREIIIAHTKNK